MTLYNMVGPMTHLVETNAIIMSSGQILNFPYISVEVRLSSVHDLITQPSRLMKLSWRTWTRVCNEDLEDLMIFPSSFPGNIFLGFYSSPNSLGSQNLKWGIPLTRTFLLEDPEAEKNSAFNAWKESIWPKIHFVMTNCHRFTM